MDDLVLNSEIRSRLTSLTSQQKKRDKLRAFGLKPSSKLLLVGPPGSGKTMTASAIAGDLHLPLFSVRLDTVITRFMGETATKLRLIFDQIRSIRGVYLFDEFDALGGKRTADNDVGEMRRVLNSFLQFLEEPNSTDSVVIAATNHPDLLDRALFRRFDEIVEYGMPDEDLIRQILGLRLGQFGFEDLVWAHISKFTEGLSQAELTRASEDSIKQSILSGRQKISLEDLTTSLHRRRALRETLLHLSEQTT
ncbi:AAA family ATPase [Tunturiibacter gelidiferens]|uniref:AAA family ATPase n=1 Tax=Tunturiibacter gelidiferens TaxID=3069689 RepID=UPI003D9BD8D8